MDQKEQKFQIGDKVLVTERIRPCPKRYEFLIDNVYTVCGTRLYDGKIFYKFAENPMGDTDFGILGLCLELAVDPSVPDEILDNSFCDLIFGGE